MIRTSDKGAGNPQPGNLERVIVSRAEGAHTGVDITWVRSRRAFRLEWFASNKHTDTLYVMEHAVTDYADLQGTGHA